MPGAVAGRGGGPGEGSKSKVGNVARKTAIFQGFDHESVIIRFVGLLM